MEAGFFVFLNYQSKDNFSIIIKSRPTNHLQKEDGLICISKVGGPLDYHSPKDHHMAKEMDPGLD